MFHIGCCGFTVAKTKYYDSLDTVEMQQTFYQPPSLRALESWRASAPAGFEFAIKAWQLITHDPSSPTYQRLTNPVPDFKRQSYGFFRPTAEVWRAWEAVRRAAEILNAKVVLFQTPPNFRPGEENIANVIGFFAKAARDGLTLAWEPRGPWKEGDIRRVCEEADVVHCTDPLRQEPCHGRIKYLRLRGKGGRQDGYTEEDINQVIDRYKSEPEVYLLFNNSAMYQDALKARELCSSTIS